MFGVPCWVIAKVVVYVIVVVTPFTGLRIISFVDRILACLLGGFKHLFCPLRSFGKGNAGKVFFVTRKWMFFVHISIYYRCMILCITYKYDVI